MKTVTAYRNFKPKMTYSDFSQTFEAMAKGKDIEEWNPAVTFFTIAQKIFQNSERFKNFKSDAKSIAWHLYKITEFNAWLYSYELPQSNEWYFYFVMEKFGRLSENEAKSVIRQYE